GDLMGLDHPVVLVDWWCAMAYAEWQAAQSGCPWRLPGEWEWEKAARGVGARTFLWGEYL
ncbi:MAG: sulfatase activating formylglycine-generating enzyme, partial [Myxococcota bacterium]